jgi:hypothetical protein
MARVVIAGPCVYFPDGPCGDMNPRVVGGGKVGNQPACKFTYIDKTGRVITQARFDSAREFSEGLASARIGSKWGFIDKTGALVVDPRFDDAEPFSSGLSRIRSVVCTAMLIRLDRSRSSRSMSTLKTSARDSRSSGTELLDTGTSISKGIRQSVANSPRQAVLQRAGERQIVIERCQGGAARVCLHRYEGPPRFHILT